MIDIEKLAREAGINTKFWDMGAGSVLFVSFVDGIPRSNFEHFAALVLEQAALKCDGLDADMVSKSESTLLTQAGRDMHISASVGARSCADAIRKMKPKEQP